MIFYVGHDAYMVPKVKFNTLHEAIVHGGNILLTWITDRKNKSYTSNEKFALTIDSWYRFVQLTLYQDGKRYSVIDPCGLQLNEFESLFVYFHNYQLSKEFDSTHFEQLVLIHGQFFVDMWRSNKSTPQNALTPAMVYLINTNSFYDPQIYQHADTLEIVARLVYKYHSRCVGKYHWINSRNWSGSLIMNKMISAIHNPIAERNAVYGFKAFVLEENGNLRCRNFTFNTTEVNVESFVYPCIGGFHFCSDIEHVYEYYDLNSPNIVLYQVKAWGVVMQVGNKTVCNHLQILNRVMLNGEPYNVSNR